LHGGWQGMAGLCIVVQCRDRCTVCFSKASERASLSWGSHLAQGTRPLGPSGEQPQRLRVSDAPHPHNHNTTHTTQPPQTTSYSTRKAPPTLPAFRDHRVYTSIYLYYVSDESIRVMSLAGSPKLGFKRSTGRGESQESQAGV
jgi:hypothetical protein